MFAYLEPIDPSVQVPVHDYWISLGDATFRLAFRWAERSLSWYLYVYDQDDNALVCGKRLSANWPVLARFIGEAMPQGQIALYDTSEAAESADYESFGNRHKLIFFSASEYADRDSDYSFTVEPV